jgi:hypothetical protein
MVERIHTDCGIVTPGDVIRDTRLREPEFVVTRITPNHVHIAAPDPYDGGLQRKTYSHEAFKSLLDDDRACGERIRLDA